MFSQYSWWDFSKILLSGLFLYYAFVLIKYYREEIREYFSNWGQPKLVPQVQFGEEDDLSGRFQVTDYSRSEAMQPIVSQEPNPADAFSITSTISSQNNTSIEESTQEEVEVIAPVADSDAGLVFSLPIGASGENTSEQSIDEVIQLTSRIVADEQGVLTAASAEDLPAAKLAAVINGQQGRAAFADINFTR